MQRAAVGKLLGRIDRHAAVGQGLAGQGGLAGGRELRVAGGIGVLEGQVAVGRQHQVARQRRGAADAVDAQAFFRGDQVDLPGVHAAQGLDVDREARCIARAVLRSGLRQGTERSVHHLVGADHGLQVLRVDLALDDEAARVELELLLLGGVQAVRAYMDHPLAHIEAGDGALRRRIAQCRSSGSRDWH